MRSDSFSGTPSALKLSPTAPSSARGSHFSERPSSPAVTQSENATRKHLSPQRPTVKSCEKCGNKVALHRIVCNGLEGMVDHSKPKVFCQRPAC